MKYFFEKIPKHANLRKSWGYPPPYTVEVNNLAPPTSTYKVSGLPPLHNAQMNSPLLANGGGSQHARDNVGCTIIPAACT